MPQVFDKSGKPIPEAQIPEAIASGNAYAQGRIAVRDASGAIGTIDAKDLGHPGYQVLSDQEIERERIRDERGTLGQQAITAVEGALRGPSGGLSDVVATGVLGEDYRKAALERQIENRKTAIGSELGGIGVAALLTGGVGGEAALAARGARAAQVAEEASGLAKAARFIPSNLIGEAGGFAERTAARLAGEGAEGLMARMAQRAAAVGARGAVEGGFYGAGQEVSRSALEDSPITAEKLLAGFGHGALYGGGAGAGLGAAGSLASGAIGKLTGGRGVRDLVEAQANKSALEAAGFGKGDLERLASRTGRTADQAAAELGPELLNYTFESGPLAGKKLFTAAKSVDDFADDIALARQEVAGKVNAAREGVAPDLGSYFQRVENEVLAPMRKSTSGAVRSEAQAIESELRPLMEQMAPGDFERLASDLRAAKPEQGRQLASILDQEIDQAVTRNLESKGLDPAAYTQQKKTLEALTQIDEVAQKAAEKGASGINAQEAVTGLSMAIGALMSGNVGGFAMGAGGAIARKLIKERGNSVLALMADNVAKMDGRIQGAAQALAGAPQRAITIATARQPSLERFESTAETVRAFNQDPRVAQEKLAKPVEAIAPVHPQLAAQMQQTLQGDYAYLGTLLPQTLTRSGNSLTPQVEKGRVPKSQQAKFMQAVEALENPGAVIERIAHGELPMAQIDALKARRPEIYQQMRTEVIKATATATKPISFLERTRLSLAFEFNADASLDPQTLQAIQSSNREATRPPDEPATPQGSKQQQPKPANLNAKEAQSMVLPSQKAIGS